jgi:hypothetical protein
VNIRVPLIASLLLVGAMLGLSAWVWPQLPDGARIARLFMLAGAITLVASVTFGMKLAGEIMIAALLAAAVIGIAASYIYWRRDPARHAGDGVPE